MSDDPMTAVLDLLAAHAERIDKLDAQAAGLADAAARIAQLTALAAHADERITALAARLDQVAPPGRDEDWPYQPAPPRQWWKLAPQDREPAVLVLRGWVEQVYRPGYGQLAATLGPCWDQHDLCLYAIDLLAELWSVLYLSATRSLALLTMQAEYQARILPAMAEQMATETARCRHRDHRLTISQRSVL